MVLQLPRRTDELGKFSFRSLPDRPAALDGQNDRQFVGDEAVEIGVKAGPSIVGAQRRIHDGFDLRTPWPVFLAQERSKLLKRHARIFDARPQVREGLLHLRLLWLCLDEGPGHGRLARREHAEFAAKLDQGVGQSTSL